MTARETWVWRDGQMMLKQDAPPRRAGYVISDSLGGQLEHHGYSDGRRTDSKSVFRRWTKEAGLVEKGNDRDRAAPVDDRTARREMQTDVARSIQMLREGYRPRLTNIAGD